MAPSKFLSEEMVLDSDSDYEQREGVSSNGKARATSKSAKKRTSTSAVPGHDEPQLKHQKTFHPRPAKTRGKNPNLQIGYDDIRPKDSKRTLEKSGKVQTGGEKDQVEPKKIVEPIAGVLPTSLLDTSDSFNSPIGSLASGRNLKDKVEAGTSERRSRTTGRDHISDEDGKQGSEQAATRRSRLSTEKDVKNMSNRRDRNPPDLECAYRVSPSPDWVSHLEQGKVSNPDLPDFPMRGPIESPGLFRWEGDVKSWRNDIRKTLRLKDYGLSLSFVWAKIDNAEGKAVVEPPSVPIFSKHKQLARPYEELIARMSHGRASKATFILKFEVGEEVMED